MFIVLAIISYSVHIPRLFEWESCDMTNKTSCYVAELPSHNSKLAASSRATRFMHQAPTELHSAPPHFSLFERFPWPPVDRRNQ